MAFSEPDKLKVAVTAAAVGPSFTVQAAVPEQAPDHPAKLEFAAGFAVSVTDVPVGKFAVHVCPQLIAAGLLVIVPVPGPVAETLREPCGANAAPTVVSELRTTVHFPTPEQAPDQPENEPDAAGVALRVIEVPGAKDAVQVAPQLMPAGELATVPEPVGVTVRVKTVGLGGGLCCCIPPPQAVREMAR